MKVFIIFLGLFMISTSAIVYQGDLGRYSYEQLLIKEAAEECAAGAALFLEDEEYSAGNIVFNYEEGEKYIEEYLAYIKRNSKALSNGIIGYKMTFEDEKKGYSVSNVSRIPAITVEIKVSTDDLFRVPFIEVTSLERSARYELPEEVKKKHFS